MGKILQVDNLSELISARKSGKTIVLVGGCFDILHAGHIEFLAKTKSLGNFLVILLESDARVRKLKGLGRPVNRQRKRGEALAILPFVDAVLLLPDFKTDHDYEILVKKIKPDIIAITAGTKVFDWERDFVNKSATKMVEVMKRKKGLSTTEIVRGAKL